MAIDKSSQILSWLQQQTIAEQCSQVELNTSDTITNEIISTLNDVEVILLVFGYTFAFLMSFVGNAIAIGVFTTGKFSNSDEVRPLVLNFAFVNIVSAATCIPFTVIYQLTKNWPFSPFLCHFISGLQVIATAEAMLTHLAIGFNRLQANFCRNRTVTLQNNIITIAMTWIFSILLSIPAFIHTERTSYGCYEGKRVFSCSETWAEEMKTAYTWILLIFMFILPCMALVGIYGVVANAITNEEISEAEQVAEGTSLTVFDFDSSVEGEIREIALPISVTEMAKKQRMLSMLQVTFLVFLLSRLPLHLLFISLSLWTVEELIFEHIYWICHWLSVSVSFTTPIVFYFYKDLFNSNNNRSLNHN